MESMGWRGSGEREIRDSVEKDVSASGRMTTRKIRRFGRSCSSQLGSLSAVGVGKVRVI